MKYSYDTVMRMKKDRAIELLITRRDTLNAELQKISGILEHFARTQDNYVCGRERIFAVKDILNGTFKGKYEKAECCECHETIAKGTVCGECHTARKQGII